MRSRSWRLSSLLALAWPILFGQSHPAADAGQTIYVLWDEKLHVWCGYASESQFRENVKARLALSVGKVTFSADRVASVGMTEVDETGDWAVNDEYLLDVSGNVIRLDRTTNIIPDAISKRTTYAYRKGRLQKLITKYVALGTAKPIPPGGDWLEEPAVATTVRQFPFTALINERRQLLRPAAEVCVAPSQN